MKGSYNKNKTNKHPRKRRPGQRRLHDIMQHVGLIQLQIYMRNFSLLWINTTFPQGNRVRCLFLDNKIILPAHAYIQHTPMLTFAFSSTRNLVRIIMAHYAHKLMKFHNLNLINMSNNHSICSCTTVLRRDFIITSLNKYIQRMNERNAKYDIKWSITSCALRMSVVN